MELLQIGSLSMTKVSSSPMGNFVPEMKVFSLPYVFRDQEHYWKVLDSEFGRSLLAAGESVRLRGLGYYDAGSRSFYTVKKPIYTPDDLAGLKIRVQKSPISVAMVRSFGGAGTPISWGELYTALDQNVVDGAENNPPSFYSSRHYEVAKYYSLNEHSYVPDIVLISNNAWNKLNDQRKAWLEQAMRESEVFQRELWLQSTEDSLAAVQAAGVEIIRPDRTLFAKKVEHMHESLDKDSKEYQILKTIKAM
jgi:tripartite ATP-independent transporter DctP family solute receptor